MKTILTDIDGVVLDWETSFHQWVELQGEFGMMKRDVYGVNRRYGIDKDRARRLVSQFNNSAWIGYLKPLRDAAVFMNRIHYELDYNFVTLTSLSNDSFAQKARTSNLLTDIGFVFSDFNYLDTGADKDEALAELYEKHGSCYWLEDKPENYVAGEKAGFKSLLMQHNHSDEWAKENNASVVTNWEEVYNILKEEEK